MTSYNIEALCQSQPSFCCLSFSLLFMGDMTLSRRVALYHLLSVCGLCKSVQRRDSMTALHPLYQPGVYTNCYVPLLLLSEMHIRLHLFPSWPQREAGPIASGAQ